MFSKILIANRGEIAVRIIRACRDLGISPVAVYSEADAASVHVGLCDEAVCIGPAPSLESYLHIPAILAAAKSTNSEAIHPGYGFLAENADFARAVTEAGLKFIGPGAEAMEIMGSKTSARRAAVEAGVPIVPGTVEPLNSLDEAQNSSGTVWLSRDAQLPPAAAARACDSVASSAELQSGFESARSEAASAFGDSSVYLEKAIARPRHIEIQVFADSQGNVVHLGERECSIQRRHQKVIEECPSPINDSRLRETMGAAAVKLARAVNYVGAGTVEFLVADETRDFYFLEMNTRLQVEHPVTELVTGIDLVREQITVAAGAPLSFSQEEIRWSGHAIECRVYAEDPENNFFPSPGKISYLQVPFGPGIRDDSGVELNSRGVNLLRSADFETRSLGAKSRRERLIDFAVRWTSMKWAASGPRFPSSARLSATRNSNLPGSIQDLSLVSTNVAPPRRMKAALKKSRRDIAVIAAAIHHAKLQREANYKNGPRETENRWKLSSRAALHEAQDAINLGRKRRD